MIFEDFEAIHERLKHIQEQEMRNLKSKRELDDDAADDALIGNDEDENAGYEEFRDGYVGCDYNI